MKKKICAWMLAMMLMASVGLPALAGAENFETVDGTEEAEELPRIPDGAEILDHLDVANPTPMRGEFFTNFWGNATSDIDVRELLHGYNLVVWNGEEGMFMHNPSVIREFTVMKTETEDHQFLMTLHNDLYYSDGTLITAWDYAFSMLLSVSPVIRELGGVPHEKKFLKGYDAYVSGESQTFPGIRVLGDNVLMITVDSAYLPFFFEMGLLDCKPYPIGEIAPGIQVLDDGRGVYLSAELTAEMLRETILDPETGYMSHPRVVSGPYTLTGWDGEVANFAINPWYKGDEAGILPVIGTLSYRSLDNEHMMDALISGEVGLLDKVTRSDSIARGTGLIGGGEFAMSNYPRIGLSYISFARERATVSEQAVRQAIAWCVNRGADQDDLSPESAQETVTGRYTGNYGIRVDGYYGVGQWMYGVITGTVIPEQEATENWAAVTPEQWDALNLDNLTVYTLDTDRARTILDRAGWKLNAQGIREKEIDGETVTLDLKMIYPVGNNINEIFEELLVPNLAEVGIRLTMEAVPMGELLGRWYGQETRDADMIYLASNFDLLFDPAAQFTEGEDGSHSWYYTKGTDEELYQLTLDMDRTQPGDVYTYMQKWILFQEKFNETLPMLPIYSNVYFDFYTANLHDFAVAEKVTWSQAVVASALYIAPPAEEETEAETDETEEDEDGYETFD